MKSITIIVPALNEEQHILQALNNSIEALNKANLKWEIIVINDGSTDRTREIVEEVVAGNPLVRIVNHDMPQGLGASFWDGVDHSHHDAVVVIPGDNENDPWEIIRYYKLLEHVDMIIPFVFNKEARSVFRNTLSWVYRFIVNSTFKINLNYTNGTVLYRKAILKELEYRSSSFFFQTDILIRLIDRGYLFAEVPYRLDIRQGGKSKAVGFPSLLQVIRGYLRLVRDQYLREKMVNIEEDTLTSERCKPLGVEKPTD
jgi:glycosyltransferase involved in cell wall biosynthesis